MHDSDHNTATSPEPPEASEPPVGDADQDLPVAVGTHPTRLQRNARRITLAVTLSALAVLFVVLFRTNPYVPPGHEGYVYERPRVFGNGGFRGTITGPGNFGMSFFRHEVVSVDMLPTTYTEEFDVLTQDDLNIRFRFHAVISIEPGSVVRIVEQYGGVDWYVRYVKETFRTYVRDSVQQHKSVDVKTSMDPFARTVHTQLAKYLQGTPFKLISLVVGDIDYPETVAQAVERKLAAQQLLEEKDTQELIALKDARIEVERAKGVAEAQKIIDSTLTRTA